MRTTDLFNRWLAWALPLLLISTVVGASTWMVDTPSGLNFRDDHHRKIVALAEGTKVKAIGKTKGLWGEFELQDGRRLWAYTKYMRNLGPSVVPSSDRDGTEAQSCPYGDRRCLKSSRLLNEAKSLEEQAAAQAVTHTRATRVSQSGYSRPVPNPPSGRGFGRQADPFTGYSRHHNGQDFPAPMGTKVHASKAGIVVENSNRCPTRGNLRCGGGYGNTVLIRHSDGNFTFYAHLQNSASCPALRQLRSGQKVEQNDIIACVGTSGHSTGPHLHFEVRVGSPAKESAVNPMRYVD